MNRRFQTALTVLCGMAMVGAGLGCEDSEARQRADVQQQIADARAQFQRASLGTADPSDEHVQQTRSELNRIVSTLQGVTDGAPGQQAAKSLLMAEALRELSLIEFRGIEEKENDYDAQRQMIRNRLLGLQRLAAVRQAREAVSAEQHRAELAQFRRATDEQLRGLQQQLARISEPIADLSERNERDFARIDGLRRQSTELIRRAEELGPADGFEKFQEGIRLQREADLIEFRTAQRELELLLEHQPAHDMTRRGAEAAEDMKEQIQRAIRDLESFDQLYASAASKLRGRIEEGRVELREHVERISAAMKDELSVAYDEATGHLERAARQARQSATQSRGDEANLARLIEARANESLGRLYWRQAGGVADHIALLTAIVADGNAIGDTQPYQAMIAQFSGQHETLVRHTTEAYESVRETLGRMTGAAAQEVSQYLQNIDTLILAMQGERVDVELRDPPQPVTTRDRAPSQPVAPAGGVGFDSPEALVEFLSTMDETSTSDVERMMTAIRAETRLGRAYTDMMNSMTRAMVELMSAVDEQFGSAAVSQLSQAAGGGTNFDDIRITDQTDSRATVSFRPMPSMPDGSLDLIRIDGQWFIDGDSLADDQAAEPGQEEFAIAMLEQMAAGMSRQISDLTRRVRGGEFASIDEFMQTMMQMMMQGMGGMQDSPG